MSEWSVETFQEWRTLEESFSFHTCEFYIGSFPIRMIRTPRRTLRFRRMCTSRNTIFSFRCLVCLWRRYMFPFRTFQEPFLMYFCWAYYVQWVRCTNYSWRVRTPPWSSAPNKPWSSSVTASGSSISEDFEHKAAELNITTFCVPCGIKCQRRKVPVCQPMKKRDVGGVERTRVHLL